MKTSALFKASSTCRPLSSALRDSDFESSYDSVKELKAFIDAGT